MRSRRIAALIGFFVVYIPIVVLWIIVLDNVPASTPYLLYMAEIYVAGFWDFNRVAVPAGILIGIPLGLFTHRAVVRKRR
jgi:hypothetical protein